MRLYFLLSFCIIVSGCVDGRHRQPDSDPYEERNRIVHQNNIDLDKNVLTPLSHSYCASIPLPFRRAISNVFNNLSEATYGMNALLQQRYAASYKAFLRIGVNTLFGVGGVFEMGNHLGLKRESFDFGQTMFVYGYKNSDFVMLPILGPCTIRDGVGTVIDRIANPILLTGDLGSAFLLHGVDLLSTKFEITAYLEDLPPPSFVNDSYIFVRDSWLQYRAQKLQGEHQNWDEFYENE